MIGALFGQGSIRGAPAVQRARRAIASLSAAFARDALPAEEFERRVEEVEPVPQSVTAVFANVDRGGPVREGSVGLRRAGRVGLRRGPVQHYPSRDRVMLHGRGGARGHVEPA